MKQINYKKLILPNTPYVFFVYLFDKVGQAVRLAPGADISAKILNITQGFSAAFESALPSIYPLDLLVGIVGAVIIRLIVYVKGKNAKKYRKGAEYGSARWGNAEDIKPYIDPEFQNNIILTQTERLTMNSRPKQPKYARNKNVVVIGGSGSGKTRFFVKPNLMQLHSSYVLTDPKGTVLIECGKLLQRAGYRIKVLNTINFKKSIVATRYNTQNLIQAIGNPIFTPMGGYITTDFERSLFLWQTRKLTVSNGILRKRGRKSLNTKKD